MINTIDRRCYKCLYSRILTISSLANIPLFLYPFLNTVSKTRPFEYLRLTSLGVIGALVKVWITIPIPHRTLYLLVDSALLLLCSFQKMDDTEVINFLLSTEKWIPLCLRIMVTGTELSKTVRQ